MQSASKGEEVVPRRLKEATYGEINANKSGAEAWTNEQRK